MPTLRCESSFLLPLLSFRRDEDDDKITLQRFGLPCKSVNRRRKGIVSEPHKYFEPSPFTPLILYWMEVVDICNSSHILALRNKTGLV